jgi:hypothetical protein
VKTVNPTRHGWIEFRNTFKYTVAELLQANQDACPVFERLVRSIDADSLRVASNDHRSVNIHLEMNSNISDKQGTAPNVTSAKIDCRWIDTDKSLMDYEAIEQNRYTFEAEVGMYRLMCKSHLFV